MKIGWPSGPKGKSSSNQQFSGAICQFYGKLKVQDINKIGGP